MNQFENSRFGETPESKPLPVDIDPELFAASMDPNTPAHEIMQEAQLANLTPEQLAELKAWEASMGDNQPPTLN